jgi:hypothetical protein
LASQADTETVPPVPTKVYQALGPDGSNEALHIIGVSGTPTFDQVTDVPTAMLIAESQVSPGPSAVRASIWMGDTVGFEVGGSTGASVSPIPARRKLSGLLRRTPHLIAEE